MRRVLTWRWIGVHLGMVVLVVGFLLLAWWQIDRARGGNALSFGYAIEWPAFAVFVIYVWQKELRAALRSPTTETPVEKARPEPVAPVVIRASERRQRLAEAAYDDSGDDELAAYNRYLAWLTANPGASPSQYPGRT
jgi:DNA-binding transcriptional regulator of glucitol operon